MHYRLKIDKRGGGLVRHVDYPDGYSSMKLARTHAVEYARELSVPIAIERVTDGPLEGREGFERGRNVPQVATVLVVHPDNTFSTPPAVKTIGPPHVTEGTCFCTNCRAARKARSAPFAYVQALSEVGADDATIALAQQAAEDMTDD